MLMAEATLTVTLDDGDVFVDVAGDVELVEAIGMLEMAKAVLLAPEGES